VTTHLLDAAAGERQARVVERMLRAQDELVAGLEALEDTAAGEANGDGRAAGRFGSHTWTRPAAPDGGDRHAGRRSSGGGRARIIEGGLVFERGGVNVSAVRGDRVPPTLAAQHPGTDGLPWFATGVSLVLHPRNPYVPAFHANFRFFEMEGGGGPWWFGGGADLTPSYPFADDVRHFHATLAGWCARHPQADYAAWKANCDAYFTVRHRGEMRGVGGVFFDELSSPAHGRGDHDFEADLACVADGTEALLPAYVPLVARRRGTPFGERERHWQAIRRGRYVEFNLVYDRGTLFGLQTGGHIEAILMSMPPVANWAFDHRPESGSPEDAALAYFQPRDWDVDVRTGATRRTP
jgi:coproporphyrinogen III oxidase